MPIALLCTLFGVTFAQGDTPAEGPPLGDLAQVERLQKTLAAVAEAVSPSVVAISSRHRVGSFNLENEEFWPNHGGNHRGPGSEEQWVPAVGSGIIIRPDGFILQ